MRVLGWSCSEKLSIVSGLDVEGLCKKHRIFVRSAAVTICGDGK